MSQHKHHEELIANITKAYETILKESEQAIYIYLDDTHKVCNKKFATLLGYSSTEEWVKIDTSFPETFVDKKSQETLVNAYQNAMEKKIGSLNTIIWKKKDGSPIKTQVILVPISSDNHIFALHFIWVI